jgi:hypothetical protein
MAQQHEKHNPSEQPVPAPIEPGHVMRREHYERLAREAAAEKQK